eukprot:2984276-Alexandrium_andersonii.AAC.1
MCIRDRTWSFASADDPHLNVAARRLVAPAKGGQVVGRRAAVRVERRKGPAAPGVLAVPADRRRR